MPNISKKKKKKECKLEAAEKRSCERINLPETAITDT
jgi:hypothetical protein